MSALPPKADISTPERQGNFMSSRLLENTAHNRRPVRDIGRLALTGLIVSQPPSLRSQSGRRSGGFCARQKLNHDKPAPLHLRVVPRDSLLGCFVWPHQNKRSKFCQSGDCWNASAFSFTVSMARVGQAASVTVVRQERPQAQACGLLLNRSGHGSRETPRSHVSRAHAIRGTTVS
jgi:hypothetical protein